MENKLIKPVIKVYTTKYKEINLPEQMSTELAELVGIHFGDGGIHVRKRKTYNVTYCFNIKEKELIEDLKFLFKKLFHIEIKQNNRNNAAEFYCCSKMLAYFLNQNFGTPLGKKDSLKIPSIIKRDKEYLCAFIRGLYRTDGCLTFNRKNNCPIIKITNKNREFIEEIKCCLIQLGFRANLNPKRNKKYEGYDVTICGRNQLDKWKKEILNETGDAGIRTQIRS